MMLTLRLRPEAKLEFDEAVNWYEQIRPGSGQKFVAAVDSALLTIENSPERFPMVHRNIRLYSVRQYPYQIFYRVNPPDAIEVIAIYHARRNPEIWKRR